VFPRTGDTATIDGFPDVSIQTAGRLMMVPMGITQSYVRMSLPMFQRPHPDYFPCVVLNQILGGSSTSRLNTVVRSDAGLTYHIYSTVTSSYVFPGTFYVQFFTKTQSTLEAMKLVLREIDHVRESGVSEEELETARKVLVDGLPSLFRNKQDLVEHYTLNEYLGREPDYFIRYPERIRAVTAQDVARVAATYLHTDSLTYIVVGDTSALAAVDTSSGFSLRALAPAVVVPLDSLAARR